MDDDNNCSFHDYYIIDSFNVGMRYKSNTGNGAC